MAAGSVPERVRGLFRETLSVEPPASTADLIDGGLLDSLALVELIFAIEQEFGVSIRLDSLELDAFRSLDTITAFVESQIADAA
jgi:acyl carrier protein